MKAMLLVMTLAVANPAAQRAPPAEAKEDGLQRVELPAPRRDGAVSLELALQDRRSVRRFGAKALSLEEAGQLLWAAQGRNRPDGRRTVPSAGALYPLEVYLVAGRVDGLPAGSWRYSSGGHALERVAAGDRRERLAGLVQGFAPRAPALIVLSAVVERTGAKYRARAERYVYLEAGCAAQSVLLQAVALGLGAVPVGAFEDAGVARALGLAPDERPLLLIPVGQPRE